ncbi:uncharacterized protein LOC111045976 [Nilaparvata lugens]|uniref:uncharacterized protein LOC111045976 n=1 Tax=Nilaparvata lugens TaxID=108931 RepID=UPI00193C94EF|nr:uncharacterized protein LOC111045976 [Nilaparvata lugens]
MTAKCTKLKYSWSEEATKILISKYESYEFLYNPKMKDYKNKNKRQKTLEVIADLMNKLKPGSVVCKAEDVRKKISNLRSQFFAEKSKILHSVKIGAENIYTPTAYWYPMMLIIEDSITEDKFESNIDREEDNEEEPAIQLQNDHVYSLLEQNEADSTGNGGHISRRRKKPKNRELPLKKSKSVNDDNELLDTSEISQEMSQEPMYSRTEDSFDTFGKFIADELRAMNNECKNVSILNKAKRKIQQTLMETWDHVMEPQSSTLYFQTTIDDSDEEFI